MPSPDLNLYSLDRGRTSQASATSSRFTRSPLSLALRIPVSGRTSVGLFPQVGLQSVANPRASPIYLINRNHGAWPWVTPVLLTRDGSHKHDRASVYRRITRRLRCGSDVQTFMAHPVTGVTRRAHPLSVPQRAQSADVYKRAREGWSPSTPPPPCYHVKS